MEVGRDAVTEVEITGQFKRVADNFENIGHDWWEGKYV